VLFSIYFISIRDFYRYLDPEDQPFAEAIVSAPDNPDPMVSYALSLLARGSVERALKVFDAVSVLVPGHAFSEFGAGMALWRNGSFREARLRWSRAVRSAVSGTDETLKNLCERLAEWEDDQALPPEADALLNRITVNPNGRA
jgi:hypothetical protein